MLSDKTKYNISILLLCALLLLTSGFGALQYVLGHEEKVVNDPLWNVEIVSVDSNASLIATNKEEPYFTNTTLSVNTELSELGATMVYDVTVKNKGNLDAYLDDIIVSADDNENIGYVYTGATKGEALAAGSSKVIRIVISYNDLEEVPADKDYHLTMTLNYKQKK